MLTPQAEAAIAGSAPPPGTQATIVSKEVPLSPLPPSAAWGAAANSGGGLVLATQTAAIAEPVQVSAFAMSCSRLPECQLQLSPVQLNMAIGI